MPEVLALLGPTASGKSSLSLEIAGRRGDIEVVAVDAFTVYRGLDVGTAKPSAAERAAVPHHLVDVLDPWEEVTVAWFQQAARAAIVEIQQRGHTPLLVGGSGLYWRAVVDDLRFPPTDATVRGAIEARYRDDPASAHAALTALDPAAAGRMEPMNLRRAVRALEVIELTGELFSSFATAWERHDAVIDDLDVAYVEPPAEVLRARIAERAAAMVAAGLIDEVGRLRTLSRPLSATAAQAIGYAEAAAVLDGELGEDVLATAIAQRTWRYAKRQRAWFRRDPRCVPTDPTEIVRHWTA